MKIKSFLTLLFFVTVGLFFSNRAFAYLLDEQVLKTKTGKCQIRYLTEKNTKGWYVETERNECGADGWLDGYHNIVVYNAFSKPLEKLYGYFSKGYWTGNTWIEAPLLTRSSEELGVQKATFYVAKDKENGIEYIGQMVANKSKEGAYSVFNICSPFRLLAVTDQVDLFEDPHVQQQIFKNIEKHVRRFCPAEKKVMLFVSPIIEPEQSDIILYANVDLQHHESEVVWQEEALRRSKITRRVEKTTSEMILQQRRQRETADLESIRQEVYQKIRQVNPYDESVQPERIVISEKSYQPAEKEPTFSVGSPKKPDYVVQAVPDDYDLMADSQTLKNLNTSYRKGIEPNIPEDNYVPKHSSRQVKYISDEIPVVRKVDLEDDISFPLSQKAVVRHDTAPVIQISDSPEGENDTQELQSQKLDSLKIEPVAHLFILSKIKKQPILGKAIVHVAQSGTKSDAIVDIPFAMRLQGKKLKRGWYVISGYFDGTMKKSKEHLKMRGNVRLLKTIVCKTDFCQDEK